MLVLLTRCVAETPRVSRRQAPGSRRRYSSAGAVCQPTAKPFQATERSPLGYRQKHLRGSIAENTAVENEE
ncbi:UNVERIFIED_CONTAM: hypothetical protein FKN15_057723 [Acipenser sinensis]